MGDFKHIHYDVEAIRIAGGVEPKTDDEKIEHIARYLETLHSPESTVIKYLRSLKGKIASLESDLTAARKRIGELEAGGPQTKDGVRVIPFVSQLWTNARGRVRSLLWHHFDGFSGCDGRDQCSCPYLNTYEKDEFGFDCEFGSLPVSELYSTESAARAAERKTT
jgi:hypothetical protein